MTPYGFFGSDSPISVNTKERARSDFHLKIPKVLPEFVKEESPSKSA
jgi:hypothetical protein